MTDPTFTVTFDKMNITEQLAAVYRLSLNTRDTVMALQDQISTLTSRVDTLETAVGNLAQSVDAEQEQVKDALGLLTQDNPDLTKAIEKLESVAANLGTITEDVKSTIPDQPAP